MSDTAFSTSEEPLFRKGDHFGGYELDRPLGKGGLGAVWLVRHRMLDTLFALKTLDPKVAEERPEFVKRFVREAKIASKIHHPNLVAVHDAGYDAAKDIYYLVMDYVAGGTLRDPFGEGRRDDSPSGGQCPGGGAAIRSGTSGHQARKHNVDA